MSISPFLVKEVCSQVNQDPVLKSGENVGSRNSIVLYFHSVQDYPLLMCQTTLGGIKLYLKAFDTLLIHCSSSNDLSDYMR